MRLDKWLKNTRLSKRRSSAKREADEGHILLNGRPAKPGRDASPGDRIVLMEEDALGRSRAVTLEILADAPRPVPKGEEGRYYRLLPSPDPDPKR